MDYLRSRIHATDNWGNHVVANNDMSLIVPPPQILGNEAQPGAAANIFSPDMKAWYHVIILNNEDDTGFSAGTDDDARVVIRSTGYGPGGAVARVEWEVLVDGAIGLGRACTSYAQQNVDADGAGRNDCVTSRIDATDTATFNPNSP